MVPSSLKGISVDQLGNTVAVGGWGGEGGVTPPAPTPSTAETFKEPRNQFQGIDSTSLCSLAGRYDKPKPTRFLAPIDCCKIPAQAYGQMFYDDVNVFPPQRIFTS
jgi:hypothetical protein